MGTGLAHLLSALLIQNVIYEYVFARFWGSNVLEDFLADQKQRYV